MSEPAATPQESINSDLWQPPAWVPPAMFVVIGAAMLLWNPDGWIHPLIDYGRELYTPWRLSAGDVLYRDLAYFNGPLSPYSNALWFTLFGVNMHVLTVVNLAIAAGALALLYRIGTWIADRAAATCAGAVFLVLFVFQHVDTNGNFNWLGPYSHEMTHGIALTLLCTYLLVKHTRTQGGRPTLRLLGIGLVLGAVFLTKPEVFAAAAFAVGVGLAAHTHTCQRGWSTGLRELLTIAAGSLALPTLAFLLLALAMPAGQAFQGVVGGWLYVLLPELTSLKFYADNRGTHDISASLLDNLRWNVTTILWLAPGLVLAWALRPFARASGWRAPLPYVALAFAVGPPLYDVCFAPVRDIGVSSVLVVLLITLGIAAWRILRHRDASVIALLTLGAVALGLLPKIILAVRFHLYGFGLAAPATFLAVLALTGLLPRFLARRGYAAGVYRGVAVGFLAMLLTAALKYHQLNFAAKTYVAGGPHENFRSANSIWEQPAHLTTKWILERTKPKDTLLVLPEGISINYFTRRVNPTGQINFMPPEMIMFGEARILAAIQQHPPDYCAVIHRPTGEYGAEYNLFGTHYGQRIMQWIGQNYAPVFKAGAEPLHIQRLIDGKTGLLIMKRRN